MKILKILLPYLLCINFSYAITDCNSKYNCSTNARPPKNIATNITCTLTSEKAKIPITALDVFKKDGTLKTYFGTGETVCHVLGWMDEGAEHFKDVNGLVGSYTEPITLEFKSC